MEEMANIQLTINHLRSEMVRAFEKAGDLGNETVIALSQQLDLYLFQYQQQSRRSQADAGSSRKEEATIL